MRVGFIGLGNVGGKLAGSLLRNGFELTVRDLATTYEGIRISSGNSFVHETESQVILNGSRNINSTMDLVVKDMGFFQDLADRAVIPLEISPRALQLFRQAKSRLGERAWSPNIVVALEEACGERLWAPGFPSEIFDKEPESVGREVRVGGSAQ